MNKTQEDKIQRFMADPVMADAVHQILLASFLKPSDEKDVHFLAACRISMDLLQEAWKTLDKYARKEKSEVSSRTQEGL